MDTENSATAFSIADRLLLDSVSRELDDPDVPTERLLEMLSDLTAIARRCECEFTVVANYGGADGIGTPFRG